MQKITRCKKETKKQKKKVSERNLQKNKKMCSLKTAKNGRFCDRQKNKKKKIKMKNKIGTLIANYIYRRLYLNQNEGGSQCLKKSMK